MEFGKKVYVGNYVMIKKMKVLSKADMKKLMAELKTNEESRKCLTRGGLPYIHIENVGGGWELNIGIGMTMFDALDELTVARDARGDLRVVGDEGRNAEAILTGMFVDTTIVGDAEYQTAKVKAMFDYIKRCSNDEQTVGQDEV